MGTNKEFFALFSIAYCKLKSNCLANSQTSLLSKIIFYAPSVTVNEKRANCQFGWSKNYQTPLLGFIFFNFSDSSPLMKKLIDDTYVTVMDSKSKKRIRCVLLANFKTTVHSKYSILRIFFNGLFISQNIDTILNHIIANFFV